MKTVDIPAELLESLRNGIRQAEDLAREMESERFPAGLLNPSPNVPIDQALIAAHTEYHRLLVEHCQRLLELPLKPVFRFVPSILRFNRGRGRPRTKNQYRGLLGAMLAEPKLHNNRGRPTNWTREHDKILIACVDHVKNKERLKTDKAALEWIIRIYKPRLNRYSVEQEAKRFCVRLSKARKLIKQGADS